MLASNNDYHGFYGVVTKWVLILEPKFNFKNFQADYTYGTKKSSSFNVSFLKPLRGKLKTNLTGIIPWSQNFFYLCIIVGHLAKVYLFLFQEIFISQLENILSQDSRKGWAFFFCFRAFDWFILNNSLSWFVNCELWKSRQHWFKELDRGFLADLSFKSAPSVSHNLQYEAVWRNIGTLSRSAAFAVREHSGMSSIKVSCKNQYYHLKYATI